MPAFSRSPCGERGLKCELHLQYLSHTVSLPMRGAWIEITFEVTVDNPKTVAPHAGSVD